MIQLPNIETISVILGIILSLIALFAALFKMFKKIDKIDKIDEILVEMGELKDKFQCVDSLQKDFYCSTEKEDERKALLYELKTNVHDISVQLDEVTEETRFNTSMNKVDTEVLEALADHAIKTQNANGKVHRSLEMLEKLKFNNPKFS